MRIGFSVTLQSAEVFTLNYLLDATVSADVNVLCCSFMIHSELQ